MLDAGLELSNEMRIVEYMGWGMQLDEARLTSALLSRCMRGAGAEVRPDQRARLEGLVCGTVPRWLAADLAAARGLPAMGQCP